MMTWHYQPVYIKAEGQKVFGLCEVYVDEEGRVESWTGSMWMYPAGDDMQDLQGAVERMLADCQRWEPVAFMELEPGMILTKKEEL